ncbi:MAG: crosslink repair DNA glycosylase YcaQ family protein, partial [Acidimicrobiia bacterium]|nr:crosslink repair DNA glycosylase YcaQ family protein [Acidimicrobiia bacterium]
RLEEVLEGRRMDAREAASLIGMHPNALRYAAPTGRFLIHWDGARQPLIWSVPAPQVEPFEARVELARRFLHFFGPATSQSFSSWAGVTQSAAADVFHALSGDLTGVDTPIGPGSILAEDEPKFRSRNPASSTRLLPSGDTYYLLQDDDRKLLILEKQHRNRLWTSRVWPGAILHEDEIVGTWRRSQNKVSLDPWRKLGRASRDAIEREAISLPIPGLHASIDVRWE